MHDHAASHRLGHDVFCGQELAQQLRVSNILYNSGELGEMTGHHSRVSTALSAVPFKVEH